MPQMAPMPKIKTTRATPFQFTGVDYLGPFLVKTKEGTEKRWICLFTCVVIRAIHLEVAREMTAIQFLYCLRRFIARRGKPQVLISDNATQFRMTSGAFSNLWKEINKQQDTRDFLDAELIHWQFLIEMAPWSGGFYERMVGLTKSALKKTLGSRLLTGEQFTTLIPEIEAVINSRPLLYLEEEMEGKGHLSPADFLAPSHQWNVAIPEIPSIPQNVPMTNLIDTWKKGQKLLETFWTSWTTEYLRNLRERPETHVKQNKGVNQRAPKRDDVVLLKENLPRSRWRLAKIKSLISSQDGIIRAAEISDASHKILRRPLNLLYPLEGLAFTHPIEESPEESQLEDESVEDVSNSTGTSDEADETLPYRGNQKRQAAIMATKNIKKWIMNLSVNQKFSKSKKEMDRPKCTQTEAGR